jgi:hypothetical protein
MGGPMPSKSTRKVRARLGQKRLGRRTKAARIARRQF